MKLHRHGNGVVCKLGTLGISVYRNYRGARWIQIERQPRFLSVFIGVPHRHASLWFHFSWR